MTASGWYQLSINARDINVAALEALFENLGALTVTLNAADDTLIFDTEDSADPSLWPRCCVEALFDSDVPREEIVQQVAAAGFDLTNARFEWIADQTWEQTWRAQFVPLCFAERLWIVPSWHESPPEAELVITLDPGMAFGTGTHPTTALCLEWLVDRAAIRGRRVLDYGCGSGILAIAAHKLGAAHVTAIDIDADACRVTRENAAINHCASLVIGEPHEFSSESFDVVVANLLLKPVLALQSRFAALLAPGGRLGLSGILNEQVTNVLEAYADAFKMDAPERRGEWALVTGHRR
ncbi:MAG: 50S ribosomal protein L11 methyltransferase [Gammaproteobacteria bacterium]|nr:50S ribosomal protein L11 methyltransferase [Gammaproteobacteria bacterium]